MSDGLALVTGTGGLAEQILQLAGKNSIAYQQYIIKPALPRLATSVRAAQLHPFKFARMNDQFTADRIEQILFCGNFPKDRFLQVWLNRRLFGTIRNLGDREFNSFYDHTDPDASDALRYLSSLAAFLKQLGIAPLLVKDVFPELVFPAGVATKKAPPQGLQAELPRLLVALGRHIASNSTRKVRLAQAAIVDSGQIIDVEATGTDAMLRKYARGGQQGRSSYLLKPPSVEFSPALDQPTIGPATVENCAKARLSGVVICSDTTTIVDKKRTLAALDQAGMYLYAMPLQEVAEIYRKNFAATWL